MTKICQCITMYNYPGLTSFLLKEDEAKTKCSGIMNLLFGVLVDNMWCHFTHWLYFSSPLQGSEKYYTTCEISRVLSTEHT